MKRSAAQTLKVCLIAALTVLAVISLAEIGNKILQKDLPDRESGVMRVTFFSVGEADCILLSCDGGDMLVDCGEACAEKICGKLARGGIERLDTVVATHFDSDHAGGIDEVLDCIGSDRLIMPFANENVRSGAVYKNVMAALNDAETVIAVTGAEFDFHGAAITVLAPNTSDYTDDNTSSVVLRVEYDGVSLLLCGDAPAPEETVMLAKYGELLKCDILKVAHHGSGDSSGEAFLGVCSPSYAVISCGENTYGHPDGEVLSRLDACGAEVFVTALDGDICFDICNEGITLISP